MSERRWGKWTRDGVPKRWWQSMHRYTDAEVLAEMDTEALIDEMNRRGYGIIYGAKEDPDFDMKEADDG